ncbi:MULTISPECIES: very short patch repair endonuclease [unclassified Rhodococcus (in: high G+C Gram-positive bacteria)]|uniref:very short patch repair endonuclease n=1 Tax=unclassified Rhodococcus (in: high G+C Gram-positive bacteria) TaxID=192944 RepID=UPI00146BA88D|nr:very short patch repair endonuclease [Rhodococcus sp. 105337]NME79430.1 very short patch repair endonuclease [Rhodococcus sp. 105337]
MPPSDELRPARPQTDARTSARMSRQRRRDTAPEVALRRELHRRGLRFYVDRAPLPGVRRRADLVFPRRRVAVYVDGCFWHRCPLHATDPKNNAEWWADKLAGNVERDRDTDSRLAAAGWTVIRVWEHEDPITAATRVAEALTPPPESPAGSPLDDSGTD